MCADMFQHLDAHKSVELVFELGRDISIVEEVHTDAAFEPSLPHALLREGFLLLGERERVDFAAERTGGL